MTHPLRAAATHIEAAIRARHHGDAFGFRQDLQRAIGKLHVAGCAATADLVVDLVASDQPRSELYYELRQLAQLLDGWAQQGVPAR